MECKLCQLGVNTQMTLSMVLIGVCLKVASTPDHECIGGCLQQPALPLHQVLYNVM
jgi:hypothetical protein